MNIADEYANLSSPHGYWKDGGALFFGGLAEYYSDVFLQAFGEKKNDCPQYIHPLTEKLEFRPVVDDPVTKGSVCEDLLASAIYSATERIYVFTPYLCMGDKLKDALLFAARRGADVKIIIPHIPDKKLTFAVTRTYCEELAAQGVKIFEFTPGFMHFKGVICDDKALLGSYNFDYRSMRLNYECGVLGGAPLADDMARDFESCLALSAQYEQKKRGAAVRFIQCFLRLIAPLV